MVRSCSDRSSSRRMCEHVDTPPTSCSVSVLGASGRRLMVSVILLLSSSFSSLPPLFPEHPLIGSGPSASVVDHTAPSETKTSSRLERMEMGTRAGLDMSKKKKLSSVQFASKRNNNISFQQFRVRGETETFQKRAGDQDQPPALQHWHQLIKTFRGGHFPQNF